MREMNSERKRDGGLVVVEVPVPVPVMGGGVAVVVAAAHAAHAAPAVGLGERRGLRRRSLATGRMSPREP